MPVSIDDMAAINKVLGHPYYLAFLSLVRTVNGICSKNDAGELAFMATPIAHSSGRMLIRRVVQEGLQTAAGNPELLFRLQTAACNDFSALSVMQKYKAIAFSDVEKDVPFLHATHIAECLQQELALLNPEKLALDTTPITTLSRLQEKRLQAIGSGGGLATLLAIFGGGQLPQNATRIREQTGNYLEKPLSKATIAFRLKVFTDPEIGLVAMTEGEQPGYYPGVQAVAFLSLLGQLRFCVGCQ